MGTGNSVVFNCSGAWVEDWHRILWQLCLCPVTCWHSCWWKSGVCVCGWDISLAYKGHPFFSMFIRNWCTISLVIWQVLGFLKIFWCAVVVSYLYFKRIVFYLICVWFGPATHCLGRGASEGTLECGCSLRPCCVQCVATARGLAHSSGPSGPQHEQILKVNRYMWFLDF